MDLYGDYESNVRSYCRDFGRKLVTARGDYVYDENGEHYLDFLMGSGALNYGHNDESMQDALVEYLQQGGLALGLDFHFRAKAEFIEKFVARILRPRKLDYKIQFTGPTGTNAVEAAIKLARKVTGKTNIIAFTNAFHGCTLGSLSVTGSDKVRGVSEANLSHVHRFPYDKYLGPEYDTSYLLEKMLSDPSSGISNVGALILEVIQGEGGFNVASKAWCQAIERTAREHRLLLIVDEIQSGCGRTGDFFAFENLGISPDIITVAKSISGFGLPMALTLIKPSLDIWAPAEHSGTFRGNGLAFVSAKVALDKFWSDDNFSLSLHLKSLDFEKELDELAGEFGLARKGRGFMQAIEFKDSVTAELVKRNCFSRRLVVETCGPRGQMVKVLPSLTISSETLGKGLLLLRNAIDSALRKGVQPQLNRCSPP